VRLARRAQRLVRRWRWRLRGPSPALRGTGAGVSGRVALV